jgi:hypothetical protein
MNPVSTRFCAREGERQRRAAKRSMKALGLFAMV